jgi:tetratricopeptide (TPR) repeat protein
MLDRDGNRVDRRNPQDIFVPLYNKQIPPGAGQVVHFGLEVPARAHEPIVLEAKVQYRKFDRKYLDYIFGPGKGPTLPVVTMASDRVFLPVEGGSPIENEPSPIKEVWQRWNDYGIGLFLEGSEKGGQKGELRQAEPVFQKVAELGKADGWVNLARVYQREGRIPDALAALEKAAAHDDPAAPWVINWLTGQINDRNGMLDEAIASYESVLATRIPERRFDFSEDYEVINALGNSLYNRARRETLDSPERNAFLVRTVEAYRRTLAIDSENVGAHYGLGLAYSDLARAEKNHLELAPIDDDLALTPGVVQAVVDAVVDPATVNRLGIARGLVTIIEKFVEAPRAEFTSRLEPLHEVVEKLGPVWESTRDAETKAAVAKVLEVTHKSLHRLLKPDETAEGRAVAIARKNDPAADQNAQSIVIHSLHRPGAPGAEPVAEKRFENTSGLKEGEE